MSLSYNEFLERIINDGIDAAKKDYIKEKQKEKLDGSIAGFEACRNKTPQELRVIYFECSEYLYKESHWYFRCYQLEVEWVCNVVSAMLYNQNIEPILSHLPTCNGMIKAASIIGVSETNTNQ